TPELWSWLLMAAKIYCARRPKPQRHVERSLERVERSNFEENPAESRLRVPGPRFNLPARGLTLLLLDAGLEATPRGIRGASASRGIYKRICAAGVATLEPLPQI